MNAPDATPTMSRWRIAGWSAAAFLLLLPLLLMQVTDEVNWSVGDFIGAGVLMLGVGLPLEIAVRRSASAAYRWGAALALLTAFLLSWLSLGVGVIGADGDPANVLYAGVLAVGIAGAVVARFEARGLYRTLLAVALAQGAVAVGAVLAGLGAPTSGPLQIVVLNGAFIALWLGASALFRRAASASPSRLS